MSEEAPTQAPALPTIPAEPEPATSEAVQEPDGKEDKITNGAISNGGGVEVATDAPAPAKVEDSVSTTAADSSNNKQTTADSITQDNPSTKPEYVEMKDAALPSDDASAPVEPAESAAEAPATPASAAKPKGPRRKSGGVPEHRGKKLSKKASVAKMTHIDAKPGDYFYVRLKGYPLWPAIVCEEIMLPNSLKKSRPNAAARSDGTYREEYADGGPKAKDRQFAVMYLHTNEFGWIPNYDLVDLDFEDVGNVTTSMRKDLAAARQLAAEQHDLQYFKDILTTHMQAREDERIAKEAAKAEKKKAKKAEKKKEKKTSKTVTGDDEDEDIEMVDAMGEPDSDEPEADAESTKTKKRKAEDTPQRADSVKKPRQTIKLNTPKTANGTSTPKSTKESAPKSAKSAKSKKAVKAAEIPEVIAPKEPELSAEEKRAKKEKEILFLRHKLQKGLLTRDQEPKAEEMRSMSEFVSKLEGYADLEVSIIRATKINKVLKAILKLASIPKEEEFNFKSRSQSLLDKWNKLLASEQTEPTAAAATTNGTAEAKAGSEDVKPSPAEVVNGTKESSADEKVEEKVVGKTDEKKPLEEAALAPSATEAKDTKAESETVPVPSTEESVKGSRAEPTPVEASA